MSEEVKKVPVQIIEWTPSVQAVYWDPFTNAVIYLGGQDAITKEFLRDNNITRVIKVNVDDYEPASNEWGIRESRKVPPAQTLTEDGITYHHFPFFDGYISEQTTDCEKNAAMAINTLIIAINNGERVVVHCRAGIHRSPAVVYNALTLLGRVNDAYEAYCIVQKHRPEARFHKSLVKWSRRMYRKVFEPKNL